jgi:hypothetical protein
MKAWARAVAALAISRCSRSADQALLKAFLDDEVKMSDDVFNDRRSALEAEFFRKQDAALIKRLRETGDAKQQKDALSTASGITDAAVLDRLLAMNIGADTIAALSLVPLVMVAWADGEIDDKERAAVLAGAAEAGIHQPDVSYSLLAQWLHNRPPVELVSTWKEYIGALAPTLSVEARNSLKSSLLTRARKVAEATGGFLGLGRKMSDAEANVLRDLERAFG